MPPVLITAASALNKIHDATWWKAPLALPHLCFSSRDIWWPERCWCFLQRGPRRSPESRNVPGPVQPTHPGKNRKLGKCAELIKLIYTTDDFVSLKRWKWECFSLRHLWTDKLFYKIWGPLFKMSACHAFNYLSNTYLKGRISSVPNHDGLFFRHVLPLFYFWVIVGFCFGFFSPHFCCILKNKRIKYAAPRWETNLNAF